MMSSAEPVQDPVVTSTQDTTSAAVSGKGAQPASEAPVVAKTADKQENARPTDSDLQSVASSTSNKPNKTSSQDNISQHSNVKTSASIKGDTTVKTSNTPSVSASDADVKSSQSSTKAAATASDDKKENTADSDQKEQVKGPKHFDRETYIEAPLPSKNPWKKPEPPKPPTPPAADKKPDSDSKQQQSQQSNDNSFTKPHYGRKPGPHRGGPPPRSPRAGKYYPKSGGAGRPDHRRGDDYRRTAGDDKGRRPASGASKPQSTSSQSQHGKH